MRTPRTLEKPIGAHKRCAIYTRLSVGTGLDQELNSLEVQREACEYYIARHAGAGWELMPERYDDGGFTGANLERPAFRALMKQIDAGKSDVVVVYKVDRLSRSLRDFVQVMHRLDKAGVDFVSVTQNFSTADAIGRLTLNMLMSFAEFEREMIAERTRDNMIAARKKGRWIGGLVPLGYRIDGGKLVIVEEEAKLVRELFHIYQREESLTATANVMNARGWRTKARPTRTGRNGGRRLWDKSAIYRHLTNVVYIGKVCCKGELFDGVHEGIVDDKTFQAVQQLLTRCGPSGKGPRGFRKDFFLRGLLRCRSCGLPMGARWSRSHGREYRYYVCNQPKRRGRSGRSVHSVSASAIEEFVIQQIRAMEPALLARLVELVREQGANRTSGIQEELLRLALAHQHCREEGQRMLRISEDENAGISMAQHLMEIGERSRQLEQRMAELRHALVAAQRDTVSEVEIQSALIQVNDVWDKILVRDCFRILHLLLKSIVYDRTKSEIELAFCPMGFRQVPTEIADICQPPEDGVTLGASSA
jgi:site-specific DNA recombinase